MQFNNKIFSEINYNKDVKWEGTSNSTLPYRDGHVDPFEFNKNFSNNELDNIRSKWWFFQGKSHIYCLEHRNDIIKNTGYDYRGNILKNTLAKSFFIENKRALILDKYESVWVFLVDHVKSIKKFFNYTLAKDYRDFN